MADVDQAAERELFDKWRASGDPEALGELRARLQPLVSRRVNKLRGTAVPEVVLEAAAERALMRGLKSFDPKSDAALGTWLEWQLRGVNRDLYRNQNFARIPENRITRISAFRAAEDRLDRAGTVVDTPALAKELGWDAAEVDRMRREMRKDLSTSRFEADPAVVEQSRTSRALQLVRPSLGRPMDQEIFDYVTGTNGRDRVASTGTLAQIFKTSPSQISRAKSRIATEFERIEGGIK